jgi:hypothetical protein
MPAALIQKWDPVTKDYVDEHMGVPARTPLVATITLTGTATNLSTAIGGTAHSHAAWRMKVPAGGADVLWGPEGNEVLQVDAGEEDTIPSGSLAGWFAKSNGADIDLVLVGGQDT